MSNEGLKRRRPVNPDIPWYDEAYREKQNLFDGGPDRLVSRAMNMLPTGASVIDLGAGQGRNAIPLAEQGFSVVARDLSAEGIKSMQTVIRAKNLTNLRTELRDANEPIEGRYDMAITSFMLHHLAPEDARQLIRRMKNCTNEGGLNVLRMFTAEGDLAKEVELGEEKRYYPALEEAKNLYADWELLVYAEQEDGDEKRDGTPMTNIVVYILARKPKV